MCHGRCRPTAGVGIDNLDLTVIGALAALTGVSLNVAVHGPLRDLTDGTSTIGLHSGRQVEPASFGSWQHAVSHRVVDP